VIAQLPGIFCTAFSSRRIFDQYSSDEMPVTRNIDRTDLPIDGELPFITDAIRA
jgi:hypothetical protein